MQTRDAVEENAGFFTFWLKQIFLTHAHISYQPIKTRVWQYITNQNSCDVTAVFPYFHLNTAIDQWECVYYPNYFINRVSHLILDVGIGIGNYFHHWLQPISYATEREWSNWFIAIFLSTLNCYWCQLSLMSTVSLAVRRRQLRQHRWDSWEN